MRVIEIKRKSKFKDRSNYSTEIRTTEDMYFDYKRKQEKLRRLKKSVDLEQGLTFKPNLNSSSHIVVKTSFNERNARVLEYKKLLNELGNTTPRYNTKKYTSTEIEENNKRIIERLYEKDLEKIKSKNIKTCEKQLNSEVKHHNYDLPFHEGNKNYNKSENETDQITFQLKNSDNEKENMVDCEYIEEDYEVNDNNYDDNSEERMIYQR
jgi:hypothetical protein